MSSWRSLVLLISLGFVHFSGKYQVLHPYEIAGRTTAEYIVRAFWKEAPYVEAVSREVEGYSANYGDIYRRGVI